MKFSDFLKISMLFALISTVFCKQPTEQNKAVAAPPSVKDTSRTVKVDTIVVGSFATAQIALNIETQSGSTLAYNTLALYAALNNKGKYKINSLLVADTENGPFQSMTILEKAVVSKNNEIKVIMTFELQAKRIDWEAENGVLTGLFGQKNSKQTIKSEGGSLTGTATIVFDEKSMRFLSQSSVINDNQSNVPNVNDIKYEEWQSFAKKHLKPMLITSINWTNPSCQTAVCTTGQIREQK